jgi:hypothetical protein
LSHEGCHAGWKPGNDAAKPAPRPYSRREIRACNAKYEARMMKKLGGF